ncbi:MAG: Eco47II family restriction endonuclease [Alloprevotella sp.]
MKKYSLGFIDDDVIFNHVRNTVLQYTRAINLKTFNKNLIDPIKMTFDAKVYGQTIAEAIEAECMRQIDKANNITKSCLETNMPFSNYARLCR